MLVAKKSARTFPVNFTQAILENIIKAGGGLQNPSSRDEFREELVNSAGAFLLQRWWQGGATATEIRDRLRTIERTIQHLLKVLPPSDSDDEIASRLRAAAGVVAERVGGFDAFPPEPFTMKDGSTHTDWRGRQETNDALASARNGLERLVPIVGRAREGAESGAVSASREPRHKGDEALNGFLDALTELYEEFFGRSATTMVDADSGVAGSPFLTFCSVCLGSLGEEVGSDAIRARLRRTRE